MEKQFLHAATRKTTMILRLFATAAALLAAAHAGASGGYSPVIFAHTYTSDMPLARYQAGELGILRPTYESVYLYAAWRAIALGPSGMKKAPNRPNGFDRARGSNYGGWRSTSDDDKIGEAWEAQVAKAQGKPVQAKPVAYLNCPAGSYRFATDVLAGLARRPDATPERLNAWIAAQRQVFTYCGDDPDARRDGSIEKKKALVMPVDLPAGEALHWRQLRQYQVAAANFYGEQYGASAERFASIGATPGHPMREWGAYLQLRSLARAGTTEHAPDPKALEPVIVATNAILADASLATRHEDARAVLRAARATLTPQERFAELSALLDNPAADPYLDDHLGDWRLLSNELNMTALRQKTSFIDWIQTLRACTDKCAPQRAHAEAQWRLALKERDAAQTRVWLVASAMLTEVMSPDLEKAALQVTPDAPEYLTVRHALLRHYRHAAQADKGRAIGDALLAGEQLRASGSKSAHNLVLQERFILARTLDEATPFLVRTELGQTNSDTGETIPAGKQRPAEDGLRWLNAELSVASLSALANDKRIAPTLRARIGVAAWMRADMLGDSDAAFKAATAVENTAPILASAMRNYRSAPAPLRRDMMLASALKFSLSPTVGNHGIDEFAARDKADIRADMWCKIHVDTNYWAPEEAAPPATPATPDATSADQIATLSKLKTATGYIGDWVLQRAENRPKDPELPWLLHVVVASTRGGCLDPDAKALSRKAFTVLHKRYKGSEWAVKTPYFY
jgi:hypothetical protein